MDHPDKVLIIVTGEKGGTGKSTCARGILDIFRYLGMECLAFDGDRFNAHLHRFYESWSPGVELLDLTNGGMDQLLVALEGRQPRVALVDFPAQSNVSWKQLEEDLAFLSTVSLLGYRVVFLVVLGNSRDSINALRLMHQHCKSYGMGTETIIPVVNRFYGGDREFSLYLTSKTRKDVLVSGIELELPVLYAPTYSLLDSLDTPFRWAAQGVDPQGRAITEGKTARFHISDRARVMQWLKKWEAQLHQEVQLEDYSGISVPLLLGLKTPPPVVMPVPVSVEAIAQNNGEVLAHE